MRADAYKTIRTVLVGAGNGQTILAGTANVRREIKFVQITTDVNCVTDLYFGAAAASTNLTAFGCGHIPATSGANIQFNGHGKQSLAGEDLKCDVTGAVTNLRVYVVYEEA